MFFFGRLDTVSGLQGPRRIKLESRLKDQPGWWTYSWNIFSVWCWGLMIQWYLLSCVFFLRDVLDSLNSEKTLPKTKDNSEKVWHETQRYLWKDDLPFHFVLNTEVSHHGYSTLMYILHEHIELYLPSWKLTCSLKNSVWKTNLYFWNGPLF